MFEKRQNETSSSSCVKSEKKRECVDCDEKARMSCCLLDWGVTRKSQHSTTIFLLFFSGFFHCFEFLFLFYFHKITRLPTHDLEDSENHIFDAETTQEWVKVKITLLLLHIHQRHLLNVMFAYTRASSFFILYILSVWRLFLVESSSKRIGVKCNVLLHLFEFKFYIHSWLGLNGEKCSREI